MAERPTQEVEIEFAGKTYLVRPTFKILTSIEAATDQPARSLGMKAWIAGLPIAQRPVGAAEIALSEMAVIVYWMLHDQWKNDKSAPQSPQDVGEILVEDGCADLYVPVGSFLTRAQQGNKEHVRQAEAAAKRAEEEAKRKPEGGDGAITEGPTPGSAAEG